MDASTQYIVYANLRTRLGRLSLCLQITNNTEDTLVYYEDTSTNGTLWNTEILLQKQTVVLSHKDTLDIAGHGRRGVTNQERLSTDTLASLRLSSTANRSENTR